MMMIMIKMYIMMMSTMMMMGVRKWPPRRAAGRGAPAPLTLIGKCRGYGYIHLHIRICVYGEQKPTEGPYMGPGPKTLNLQTLAFAACLLSISTKNPTFGGNL